MKTLARRLLAVGLSAAAALAVTEFGFRALSVARFERATAAFEHEHWRAEPGTSHLYAPIPNAVREVKVSPDPGAWEWKFTTQGAGRRAMANGATPPPTEGEPKGKAEGDSDGLRVVTLGDSYTFGWGVNDEQTYPAQLAERLREGLGFQDVQVLNAGVPGFNTMQEASYLASRWDELRPDLVVLGFVMNDAEPPRIAPRDPRERFGEASLWLLEELLLRSGWTDGWLTSRAQRQRAYPLQFEPGAPEGTVCRRSLGEIAARCEEHSVPLLLFILPDMTVLPKTPGATYRFEGVHTVVRGWGEELGLPTVDLLPLFAAVDPVAMQVPGDGHPSALALEIFAEAMAGPVAAALRDRRKAR